ncbi:helix-turn-helix domain-containing protein [Dactylosporangium sp. AC04546]|uniref:TetR/AcrR family transcriptional regulator n=1 Tax=Dactylosporangium sp. AC04546 TaxID=2862460 RepID=UPI001EDDF1BA|nr:helix-turn-helix domain-containing protein [Dactylosporangium sp. AC04546]WVK78360.1 helix-turn-helix domain-containing protein [Dactylosporangium sp. AC04546]
MTRLSRAETQERTHAQLLAAGRAVFLRRGFLAATVDEIAAAAGYTRGAVYKHFGGKEGLWQAILDATADAHLAALTAAFQAARSRADLLAALDPARFARRAETAITAPRAEEAKEGQEEEARGPARGQGAPGPAGEAGVAGAAGGGEARPAPGLVDGAEVARWAVVGAEYLAAVAGQPEHAARLVALQHRLDAALARLLAEHCPRLGVRTALPIPELVVALGAFGGGLALLAAADPALDAGAVADSLLPVLLLEAS